jgi:ubiquinone/menaquinone biosynthesis C-methylase UbiE
MSSPAERTVDSEAYQDWRSSSLSTSWSAFSDAYVSGKDVLDFGCGDGSLSLFLAKEKHPRQIVGVEICATDLELAKAALVRTPPPESVDVEFLFGSTDSVPAPDNSFDTLLAFDCLEHIMSPGSILQDWHRVLRPGGRCLIEWYPFKGPWGPHMEALVPIPWAHVIFGERAMFRTAEMIYDLPEFVPRHWDLDEHGNKMPNKWCAWSSFNEQSFVNELDIREFEIMARDCGFEVARLERHSFSGSILRQAVGRMLMGLPFLGEYFVSYAIIELVRRE